MLEDAEESKGSVLPIFANMKDVVTTHDRKQSAQRATLQKAMFGAQSAAGQSLKEKESSAVGPGASLKQAKNSGGDQGVQSHGKLMANQQNDALEEKKERTNIFGLDSFKEQMQNTFEDRKAEQGKKDAADSAASAGIVITVNKSHEQSSKQLFQNLIQSH